MGNLLTEFHQTEPYHPSELEGESTDMQQVPTEFDPLGYFFETMNLPNLRTDSSFHMPQEFNPSSVYALGPSHFVMRPGKLITMIFR